MEMCISTSYLDSVVEGQNEEDSEPYKRRSESFLGCFEYLCEYEDKETVRSIVIHKLVYYCHNLVSILTIKKGSQNEARKTSHAQSKRCCKVL